MFCSLSVFAVLFVFSSSADTIEGNFKILARSLEKCGRSHDWGTCLRLKAVSMLDQALYSSAPVVINDFLSLSPDTRSLENETVPSENEIEKALASDPSKKDDKLDDMIADRMARYLSSRSLKFSVPSDLTETGRKGGKDKGGKKGGMMMMAAVAMGGMMMQMMMGKVAMLAGKALLIGKMALLLSAIMAMKKMMGGGGGDSAPQVVYATESHSSGHGGGWGRSIADPAQQERANQLAYRGSVPAARSV